MSNQPATQTIQIEGRVFTVERREDDGQVVRPDGKPDGPVYWLTGTRGAVYFTLRNVPKPHMMFLVNATSMAQPFPGTWLTDQDGELRVIR